MDLSVIKSKLGSFSKPQNKEKIDYKKVYFKPTPGEYSIRIVPSVFDKSNPFREVFIYYGITKFPTYSLINWGEKDPIIEFIEKLKNVKVSKEESYDNWKLSKKLEPKMRVFVPVIIRGQESEGVKLWDFGMEVYKQLLSLADDDDYGDYTSETNGRDFKIKVEESTLGNRKINKVVSINIRPKQSPITDNPELLEKILTEQPDVLKINRKPSYDELKNALIGYLEADETDSNDNEENTEENTEDAIQQNIALDESNEKKSNLEKFDNLFNK